MKQSLSNKIIEHLKRRGWTNGGDLEVFAIQEGYKGSTASRVCRQLREDGIIIDELRKGDRVESVWYKYQFKETLF